jgi:hypothetical protein
MTRDEFAKGYAARSGKTIEWLKEHGREARSCDCGEDDCPGWQMAHIRELQWAVDNDVASDAERNLLAEDAGRQ